MSLTKKRTLTEKRMAASQANGKRSRGPATPKGRERMRLKMRATSWQLLAQSVAQEHYVTTPADLDQVKSLRDEGAMKELGDIAVALFYQLQEPGRAGPG
jgi:hypothetical protein